VRGAQNLSPGELEDVLHERPAVAACAVVGAPDEQWGAAVAAVIVTHSGRQVPADELREWVPLLRKLAEEARSAYAMFNNNGRSPAPPGSEREWFAQAPVNALSLQEMLR